MASSKYNVVAMSYEFLLSSYTAKIPKPKDEEGESEEATKKTETTELPLPQTLVRIPTEQAPLLQQAAGENTE